MTTAESRDDEPRINPRSLEVRKAAARAAVTASRKTGRPVSPLVKRLAES